VLGTLFTGFQMAGITVPAAGLGLVGLVLLVAAIYALHAAYKLIQAGWTMASKRKKKFTNVRHSSEPLPPTVPQQRGSGPGIFMHGVRFIDNTIGMFIGRGVKPNIHMGDTLFEGNKEAIHYEGDEPPVKPSESDETKP
jgi:hypothetical protein